MKKIFLAAFFLAFGLIFQAQAVSTDANQEAGIGKTNAQIQGQPAGNTVGTQEQNMVVNQGEESQIQTHEQNMIQWQEEMKNAANNAPADPNLITGPNSMKQDRVGAAIVMQNMLQMAGQDSAIAQNQVGNQIKLEQNIEKIQSRRAFEKFLIGPDYKEIKSAQETLAQNREQIRQINQIITQVSNEGDQQQLTEIIKNQIKALEQADQEMETLLNNAQKGFSLFGWLNKLLS